ncbi:MAG: hypothetical protein O3C40_21910, partial [Planctomycetota bacterium]|nr:hypothetical protein [Planctomycetota bacterium]
DATSSRLHPNPRPALAFSNAVHMSATIRLPIRLCAFLVLVAVHTELVAAGPPVPEDSTGSVSGEQVSARFMDLPAVDPAAEASASNDPPLSFEQLELRRDLRKCLAIYYGRPPDCSHHSPWSIMHTALGYGVDAQIVAGDRKANAISWLCWNNPCRGQRLLSMTDDMLQLHEGPGVQGHPGQFLAILAQARVRTDYSMKVEGINFTVEDLIRREQQTCDGQSELTFKLLALSYYLDTDATWENQSDTTWSLSRMIQEELSKPVVQGATCGGTHRLMGLSYAVRKRELEQRAFNGQWKRAQQYIHDFHEYAFKVQNPDGSFSTEWFRARGAGTDIARRLQTTGHILEWLVCSLPADELTQPRVTKSVRYLTDLMHAGTTDEWPAGPQGHAIHALALYDERVFGSKPGRRSDVLANRQSSRRDVR